jgi:hypothetical protein
MSAFDNYVSSTFADMKYGLAAVGHSVAWDVSDSYQEILLGGASISPADGLASPIGTATPEAEAGSACVDASYTDVTPPETLALPPPEIDLDVA